ncbi:MAG: PD-(D/E)XK nuclease family protein [Elusimicrobiota bacterium]
MVRGSIDLLCRQDGKLWVVDYKTDARRKKASSASPYRRQGAAYVAAVRKSLGEEAGFKLIHLRDGVVEEVLP